MRIVLIGLVACLAAGLAAADPVPVKTAEKMLFPAKGYQTVIRSDANLSAADTQILDILVRIYAGDIPEGLSVVQLTQIKGTQPPAYYGAIAFAPGDGLVSAATFMSSLLHSPEAAAQAAVDICNQRKTSAPPCVVAADILPIKWSRQPLMLNRDATAGVRDYKKGRGEKAMAVSAGTGVWSIAKGPGAGRAAVNDCMARAQPLGATDCALAIADN